MGEFNVLSSVLFRMNGLLNYLCSSYGLVLFMEISEHWKFCLDFIVCYLNRNVSLTLAQQYNTPTYPITKHMCSLYNTYLILAI